MRKNILIALVCFLQLVSCAVPPTHSDKPDHGQAALFIKLNKIHQIVKAQNEERGRDQKKLTTQLQTLVYPDYLLSSFDSDDQLSPCGPLDVVSCLENPTVFNFERKEFTYEDNHISSACLGLSDKKNQKVMAVIFVNHESQWKLAAFHLLNSKSFEQNKQNFENLCWKTPS